MYTTHDHLHQHVVRIMTIFTGLSIEHARMRDKHVDDVSLHTYIGTANLLYVTLVFGLAQARPELLYNVPS